MRRAVGVVGAGSWGSTLARILGENGNEVLLWARRPELAQSINESRENERYLPGHSFPESVRATSDLEEVCRSAPLHFLVVPSHGLRDVARRMGDFLNGEQALVHCTKGIEQGSFRRMSEILREETCVRKIGVLSGPNLARELADHQPGGTLVASLYDEVVRRSQELLNGTYFRVYGSRDVIGAEVGGAYKNIIALAAGALDGLGLGDNSKALALTRGLTEMTRYGVALGARRETFAGLSGIGDLMATCASPLSRNHQVGERLAKGQRLEEIQESMFMVAEGVKTTRAVKAYAEANGLDLPIASGVHRVLYEQADARATLAELMERRPETEFEGLPS